MIGELVGSRYRVISILGSGGFGHTYVAEDTQRPGQPRCVLKHLTFASSDANMLKQVRRLFQAEAETLEKLGRHDQIPQLLAYFEEQEQFYLVQEYIEGHLLSTELAGDQRFTEEQVIDLLIDVLGILEFVHAQGVIHRDIKPDNLVRRDRDGRMVLIDFGAVKSIANTVAETTGETSFSVPIYTSGYGASEQCLGRPRFNSDLYSLGMVGIQALTGMRPSQMPHDYATSEVIWRDRVQVSEGLAQILEQMVRYHFTARYQSASEVVQALQRLSGQVDDANATTLHPIHPPHSPTIGPPPPHALPRKAITRILGAIVGTFAIAALVRNFAPPTAWVGSLNWGTTDATALKNISLGDKTLNQWQAPDAQKQAGISHLAAGEYTQAVTALEASHQATPSDPETLIYLSNARIGNGSAYLIAAAVPMSNAPGAAAELLRGVAQAQAEINQAGGINGVPLKVAIADDHNNPDSARQVASALANNPAVLGVVGHSISDTTLASAEIYQSRQLVMISPSSSAVKLTEMGDFIFRTMPSDSFTAQALSRYMLTNLNKQRVVAFFDSRSAYSQSLKNEFKKALFYNGLELLGEVDLARPDFDAYESVNRVIEQRADVIVLASDSDVSERAIQVIQLNRRRLPILAGDSLSATKVLKVAGAEAVGMVFALPTDLTHSAFRQKATQWWGRPDWVSWRTALAYDATQALIAGLAHEPTRLGIQRKLQEPNFQIPGAIAPIQFQPSGDRQGTINLMTIAPVKGSRPVTYEIVPLSQPAPQP